MPQGPLTANVALNTSNFYSPMKLDSDGKLLVNATVSPTGAVTVADGADVAQGTTTDVAWSTGAGTLVALGKATVAAIKGNLATTAADGSSVAIGAKADTAWTAGSGSAIALLKAIATISTTTQVVSGSVTLTPAASFLNNTAGSAGVAVKASAGTLFGLSINAAGTSSTVALYNSATTTANPIGTFSTTAQGVVNMPAAGVAFSNGLWMVASTVTPANITVYYS